MDHEAVHASCWAAITSISGRIGCTVQTLSDWVKKAEVDRGRKAGLTTDMAAEAGIEPSVGSVGDNALAQTVDGLYKAELIHRRGPWRSFEAVEFATLSWVDWFSHRRLLEPIGTIPPAEAEERRFAMLDEQAIAA